MSERFNGKVIIITGASSGIGLALAQQLYAEGAVLAVCARNQEKLNNAFEGFDTKRVLIAAVDVADKSACEQFVLQTKERFGRIDILINNAGMSMRSLFEDVDITVIEKLMNINFYGAVNMTKYSLPELLKSKGTVVGVSSIAGYRGLPARIGYCSSKFALTGFLAALRVEVMHRGVNVLLVSPGFTASNIRNTSMTADGTAQGKSPLDEGKIMSAEECASIIIKSIYKRKREVIMTRQGKMAVFFTRLFPKFADRQVFKLFAKEPDNPLKVN